MRRFGRAARDAEQFLSSFEEVYVMRRLRIDGDNVILFKCYPGRWQVLPCFVFFPK